MLEPLVRRARSDSKACETVEDFKDLCIRREAKDRCLAPQGSLAPQPRRGATWMCMPVASWELGLMRVTEMLIAAVMLSSIQGI